jgi:hypothetical protein
MSLDENLNLMKAILERNESEENEEDELLGKHQYFDS